MNNELKSNEIIPNNNEHNYTHCCISDINMDGRNEILIGTYEEKVLVYGETHEQSWKLIDSKSFDSPIYSICNLDMTGDGVDELVVMSQRGVHILQVIDFSIININYKDKQ